MAKRDPSFREKILEADYYECVICGSEENLEAAHVKARGAGGVASRDTVENGITLCAKCHLKSHAGDGWQIEKWDREDKLDGLIVRIVGGAPLLKEDLWFYLRQERERVKEEIGLLSNLSLTAGARAMIMAHVFKYCKLLTDQSPEQFVAGLGLDSTKARKEADLADWIHDSHLTWPEGVNVAKVELIRSAVGEYGAIPDLCQEWLEKARDMSYSDLLALLIEEGLLPKKRLRNNLYVQIPKEGARWFLKPSIGEITHDDRYYLVRVGKVYPPLKRVKGQLYRLIDKNKEVRLA